MAENNRESVRERAIRAQDKFKEPYRKMMALLAESTREGKLAAIRAFYDVAEPTKYDYLPENQRETIENATEANLMTICSQLCTEAINRDFLSWIQNNTEGDVGRTVYNALRTP